MQAAQPPAPHVLVVDDNEANRELARAILEDEGHSVMLASSGLEALVAFARQPPACVVLDVKMPGIDGFSVCERIRAMPHGSETPVIFLTAMRDLDTFDRAAVVGADDFLTKPVQAPDLLARVKTALRLRQLGAERHELFAEVRRQRDLMMRHQLQKEEFMAFLVNDLKGPVGSVIRQAQAILQEPDISEDVREAARTIQSDARHFLRLILNLLDVNRGEEQALSVARSPTDLAALVRDVFATLDAQAEAAEVSLHAEGEAPTIAVDTTLVRRMLTNLVDSALRAAPVRSQVRVYLSHEAGSALLRVADEGKPVPPDLREAIFERQRVQDFMHDDNRGGLGLAFCKLVAEAHGGKIWVEDHDPGAMICVRLPDAP